MADGNETPVDAASTPPVSIRDRVKELRRVRAADLIPNPKNWREHDETQQAALSAILSDVGMADALVAYETPAGLMLINGHLRAGADPETVWPVIVLDVSEAEADKLLAVFDPLSDMAKRDPAKLAGLLEGIHSEATALEAMLRDLERKAHEGAIESMAAAKPEEPAAAGAPVQAVQAESEPEAATTSWSVPLTAGQQQTVLKAVKKAKKRDGLTVTGDAIEVICREWALDGEPK